MQIPKVPSPGYKYRDILDTEQSFNEIIKPIIEPLNTIVDKKIIRNLKKLYPRILKIII